MILLTPKSLLNQAQILALQTAASDAVQDIASKATQGQNVVARPLDATDLLVGPPKQANPVAVCSNGVALTGNQWTPGSIFPNSTLKQQQAVAIYGWIVQSPTPQIMELLFFMGNSPVAQVRLDEVYSNTTEKCGLLSQPIIWTGGQLIDVRALAAANVLINAEQFLPLGVVAEPSSFTVTYPAEVSDLLPPPAQNVGQRRAA